MSSSSNIPVDPLVMLVRAGRSNALLSLADALDGGSLKLRSSSVGIRAVRHVSQDTAEVAARAFAQLGQDVDPGAVAAAIRTAVGIRTAERLDSPQVEICWTGPEAKGASMTENSAAVQQLLENCQDIGEVLLVGYSFTVPKGSAMEKVRDLLIDASKRKAKIQVILHKDEEEKNKAELLKDWDVFTRKPEVYTWDPPDDHPYTKLHAKCLVVDRLQMLVTSANFTFHGLESNIELGLLVRNQPLASAVHERFDHLINAGVLHRWEEVA